MVAGAKGRRLAQFFLAVRGRIPSTQVLTQSISATDSSGLSRRCAGIIFAESEEDVAHVVRCANRYSIPIDPVSTGYNVGYGDYFPESSGQVILNLSRMNRILELCREEGWLRIQPGVSQGEVAEYLRKHAPEFNFDLTYWLKESSVLGNALERGRTLLAERERDLIGAKIVLASGEILRTGFNPQAKSPVIRGLNLHPLIFQSNLGVAVEGVLRLRELDSRARYLMTGFKSFGGYAQALPKLQKERLEGLRLLRWFCRETFAETPAPSPIKKQFGQCRGGVLAFELDRSVKTATVRDILTGPVCAIARESLMSSPPLTCLAQHTPFSFYSFAVRRSAKEFLAARKFIEDLRRRYPLPFYQTISFLETTSVFLLRIHADPARQSRSEAKIFLEIAKAIQDAGYVLYRDHSGMPTKQLPDASLKKMIKNCFDPKSVIAPGRYGLL